MLGNARLVGATLTVANTPVPVTETVWGLPEALSITLSVPERATAAEGENMMVTWQLNPGSTGAEVQLFVSEKSGKLIEAEEITRLELPVLVKVTICCTFAPTAWLPKFTVNVDCWTAGL